MQGRDGTPPHHPAFGVRVSDETIQNLLKHCMPSWQISTIVRIPHDRSYNNRIFIIHFHDRSGESSPSCVLKVNGRFFGSAKVENEAACLLLLRRFCPQLPVPKVFAWSEDGRHVTRRDGGDGFITSVLNDADIPGWILMTQLAGSPLDTSTLSTEDMKPLAGQIATALRAWRRDVPHAHCAANLHFQSRGPSSGEEDLYQIGSTGLPHLHIYGNVGVGNDMGEASRSVLDFWRAELEWQCNELATKPGFAPNRKAMLDPLRHFIDQTLSNLSLFDQTDSSSAPFIFTHTDLFPRNILVSGSPPQLTGIVDFEFSGFHPAMEEFVQDWDPDPSDDGSEWPEEMYQMMMQELEGLGERTPRDLGEREKREIAELSRIRYFIAPWWIAPQEEVEGNEGKEELVRHLERARREVKEAIVRLRAMVKSGE